MTLDPHIAVAAAVAWALTVVLALIMIGSCERPETWLGQMRAAYGLSCR